MRSRHRLVYTAVNDGLHSYNNCSAFSDKPGNIDHADYFTHELCNLQGWHARNNRTQCTQWRWTEPHDIWLNIMATHRASRSWRSSIDSCFFPLMAMEWTKTRGDDKYMLLDYVSWHTFTPTWQLKQLFCINWNYNKFIDNYAKYMDHR
jgi:hypothetical protein